MTTIARTDRAPMLDSDFDGTAVMRLDGGWRDMRKYRPPIRDGYIAMLDGFIDGGGRIGEINTMRNPLISPITYVSMYRRGLHNYFDLLTGVTHSSSNKRKSRRLVTRASADQPLAFTEDNPHTVGVHIAAELAESEVAVQITLGATHDRHQNHRLQVLQRRADRLPVVEVDCTNDDGGFAIQSGASRIDVVRLDEYSRELGAAFAVQTLENHLNHQLSLQD